MSVFVCRVCLARRCLLTVIDSYYYRFLFLPNRRLVGLCWTMTGRWSIPASDWVGIPNGRYIYDLFFVLFLWNIKFYLSHTSLFCCFSVCVFHRSHKPNMFSSLTSFLFLPPTYRHNDANNACFLFNNPAL